MNSRRFSLRLAFGCFAVVALAALPALAQGGQMGHGPHGGGMHGHGELMAHMIHKLDLSDTQRDQVHQIFEQTQKETELNRETMRVAHEVLADLMHAEAYDEASIRAAAEEVAAAQAELIVAHARALRDVRTVLTPAQLEQFQQMQELHREHKGELDGMERGRGRRHGRHGHGKSWSLDQDADESGE
jgi:Spy/CpxP family protein refolding chaperone